MLELRKVSFAYRSGQYAVKDVSLKIAAGEFVAVVGRNGSGKTTLTRLMMSLIKPVDGEILLEGNSTVKATPADMARHIGYVFQNPDRQIFRDTVEEEVAYGPEQLGFSPQERQEAVASAIQAVHLTGLESTYPRLLSKGQKQRVAIASALAMNPRLVIFDEPTSGQDCREKESLLKLLTRLNATGTAIILVTHDMEIVARFAKRVVAMAGGQVLFDGTPAKLFSEANLPVLGLRPPATVPVSRGLGAFGIPLTTEVQNLVESVCHQAKEVGYA